MLRTTLRRWLFATSVDLIVETSRSWPKILRESTKQKSGSMSLDRRPNPSGLWRSGYCLIIDAVLSLLVIKSHWRWRLYRFLSLWEVKDSKSTSWIFKTFEIILMSYFSSVHPHGCTLSWKKPLDDGGSPLTSYIIEKKDLDKDIWISCGTFVGGIFST